MRNSLLVAATTLALLSSGSISGAQPEGSSRPVTVSKGLVGLDFVTPRRTLAEAISVAPGVRQLVTVSSPRWSSTTGTLRAWRRPAGGEWVQVHGPLAVMVGYAGWVDGADREQSTGTTPAGVFKLPSAFGRLVDPGTTVRYRQYDGNDWWPYEPRDPATYNIYQPSQAASSHWRADYSEHLADYQKQYAYAIVVGFNLPTGVHYSAKRQQRIATVPADTTRGGGIFLHVTDDGPTGGCVAMPRVDVRWLLRWLDRSRHPRVAMGPHDYLVQR